VSGKTRKIGVTLATFVAALAVGCQRKAQKHEPLDALPAAFDADAGKVRVVVLASPVETPALHFVADVVTSVFMAQGGPKLAGYVVWLRPGAVEDDVGPATNYARDDRIKNYWDGDGKAIDRFHVPPGTHATVLVFPAGPKWGTGDTSPPADLIATPAGLDGEVLAQRVAALQSALGAAPEKSVASPPEKRAP
jgi:hypothetical protein